MAVPRRGGGRQRSRIASGTGRVAWPRYQPVDNKPRVVGGRREYCRTSTSASPTSTPTFPSTTKSAASAATTAAAANVVADTVARPAHGPRPIRLAPEWRRILRQWVSGGRRCWQQRGELRFLKLTVGYTTACLAGPVCHRSAAAGASLWRGNKRRHYI